MTGVPPPRYTPDSRCLSATTGRGRSAVDRRFTFTGSKGATVFRNYGVTAGLEAIALASGIVLDRDARVEPQLQGRVFELRTDTTMEGRLDK